MLGSTSAIRRQMLSDAGVEHEARASNVDEDSIKARLTDPIQIARMLAEAKARSIPGNDWVIGSDSVVSVDGRLFSKPRDREDAAAHLRFFSGRLMNLTSAVALARGGTANWRHAESASL